MNQMRCAPGHQSLEERIQAELRKRDQPIAELARRLSARHGSVQNALTRLKAKGLVKNLGSGPNAWRWALLTLLLLFAAPLMAQQTSRVYAQINFKNGGLLLLRDSLGVAVNTGSATDARRAVHERVNPQGWLGLSVLMAQPLPNDTPTYSPPNTGMTWRCSHSAGGCWLILTTIGLGSYWRPTPNIPEAQLPALRIAIVNALQGADVPNTFIDLSK